MRFNLVDNTDFTMDLEYNDSLAIVHLPRVDKWNKTVYLSIKTKIEDIFTFVETIGFQGLWAGVSPEDTTIIKGLNRFGFKERGTSSGFLILHKEGEH